MHQYVAYMWRRWKEVWAEWEGWVVLGVQAEEVL